MLKIKQKINEILDGQPESEPLSNNDLQTSGLSNITLHDYQLYGITWLYNSYKCKSGVILGDEMGLGKTLQSISFVLKVDSVKSSSKPFLIVVPLSVIDGWCKEFKRAAPHLEVQVYIGNKDERQVLRNEGKDYHVYLTSYELCLKDDEYFQKFSWEVLIVDEAHRLKNSQSQLYQSLMQFDIKFKMLLTGTPVQNDMKEIYSLLSFTNPSIFKLKYSEEFVKYFSGVKEGTNKAKELHNILKPFLLRRTKNEVTTDIPKKKEILIYCGFSSLQKKLYKALLTKNLSVFQDDNLQKTSLMNLLMQLRKCSNHPYIFPGIEKEPFMMGEHLVEASGKLVLLDKMLEHLHKSLHKVLLFSQMTTMLDILQDYLQYRGYTYERLDGSVRGEERFLAVNNFNSTKETFVFLLSTKAGGQGLNLMSADTVIFVDSDFNPQNDLQAAARAHRIGQKRPVKIIRLVSENTVEEIILRRAGMKLKLTNTVVEGGQFSNIKLSSTNKELTDVLKFGLEHILKSEEGTIKDVDIESMLGKTSNSQWVIDDDPSNQISKQEEIPKEQKVSDSMYSYEGEDYSKAGTSDADKTAFDKLAQDLQNSVLQERGSRKDSAKKQFVSLADHPTRKRKVLTDEEKEALKLKREENKIKRAKLLAEQQQEKLLKLWKSHNYESAKLEIITSDDSSDSETESNYSYVTDDETSSQKIINYVVGDVTCPQNIATKDAIIVHCVDDSGLWGSGGLFSAIDKHSTHPKDQYELSAKMKDLKVGDVHLIKMKTTKIPDQAIYVALLVAHTRNRKNELSPLLFPELTQGLQKICYIAKKTGASVHFPRIGHNTPNFNWYGTEKLIKKTLVQKGVSTSVYYYKRRAQISSDRTCTSSKPPEDFDTILSTSSKDLDTTLSTSSKDLGTTLSTSSKELDTNMEVQCKRPDGNNSSKVQNNLHDIFTGCCVFFHGFHANDNALNQLQRYVIAYDGDVTTDYWSPEMTHVVVNSGARLDDDMSEHFAGRDLTCVKLSWVYECISKKFIVPVSEHSAF